MKYIIGLVAFFLVTTTISANNLKITAESYSENRYLTVSVNWEDSWKYTEKPPYNHNAVWIFVKYREANRAWQHLKLSSDATDFELPDEAVLETVDDGVGVFLKRAEKGAGNFELSEVVLAFNEKLPTAGHDFRVFGIEMVWIPEGEFFLGDGVSKNSFQLGTTGVPFLIDDNSSITTGNNSGELNTIDDYLPEGDIPETFPNGYEGFYLMRHSITQEQYKDFLNTLTYNQQDGRTVSSPGDLPGTPALSSESGEARNNIAIKEPAGNGRSAVYEMTSDGQNFATSDDGRHRACNFLKWDDLAAYLDWAGLRPFTAFEYEKAARGPEEPVAGEFAWGTPHAVNTLNALDDGTGFEQAEELANDSAGLTLHGYDGVRGTLRPGFAGSGTTGRIATGSSYYGVLGLSGNLWEQVVISNETGLNFKAEHGTGMLDENGNSTIENWPVSGGDGAGFRGGGWNSGVFPPGNFRDLAVSDRFYGFSPPEQRRNTSGGRGARSK